MTSYWTTFGQIWANYLNWEVFAPVAWKFTTRGNSVSWQRWSTANLIIIKQIGQNDVILAQIRPNLPKFDPIWGHFDHFLIIMKCDVCHRCQDTELPFVVNFQATWAKTSQFRKFAQICPNLLQYHVILTNLFDNYQISCLSSLSGYWITHLL